jgi:hypothetical protein
MVVLTCNPSTQKPEAEGQQLETSLRWSLICSREFLTISSSSFKVSGFILRSFIHFELILVQGERQGSSFSLLHVDMQFSQFKLHSEFEANIGHIARP